MVILAIRKLLLSNPEGEEWKLMMSHLLWDQNSERKKGKVCRPRRNQNLEGNRVHALRPNLPPKMMVLITTENQSSWKKPIMKNNLKNLQIPLLNGPSPRTAETQTAIVQGILTTTHQLYTSLPTPSKISPKRWSNTGDWKLKILTKLSYSNSANSMNCSMRTQW